MEVQRGPVGVPFPATNNWEPLNKPMVAPLTETGGPTARVVCSKGCRLACTPPHSAPQFRIYAVLPLTSAQTGRSKPGTMVQTGFTLPDKQLRSTGGTALLGLSTVIASESLLKTRSWVPLELAITVCALVTAIVVSCEVTKFNISTAPRKE